jgi:hypothetical protein
MDKIFETIFLTIFPWLASEEEKVLIEAIAWQRAKDNGYSDPDDAMEEARKIVEDQKCHS